MSEFAYWINPRGKIYKPKLRHISTVIEDPEWFGETADSIAKTFQKYNEPISVSVEGKAREEILLRVIKNGYARIRKNMSRRDQSYSIQIDRLTPKIEDALFTWAMIESKDASDKYADVIVYELGKGSGSGKMTRTTLDTIASGSGIKEAVSSHMKSLEVHQLEEMYVVEDLSKDLKWKEYCMDLPFSDLSEQAQAKIFAYRMSL